MLEFVDEDLKYCHKASDNCNERLETSIGGPVERPKVSEDVWEGWDDAPEFEEKALGIFSEECEIGEQAAIQVH